MYAPIMPRTLIRSSRWAEYVMPNRSLYSLWNCNPMMGCEGVAVTRLA